MTADYIRRVCATAAGSVPTGKSCDDSIKNDQNASDIDLTLRVGLPFGESSGAYVDVVKKLDLQRCPRRAQGAAGKRGFANTACPDVWKFIGGGSMSSGVDAFPLR
jgi:hypothetical protein